MKVAVIGSRGCVVTGLEEYLPQDTTEIVSGGAKGVDACAAAYAEKAGLPLKVFLPDYHRYGRGAPLRRNRQIVEYADMVLAFWDGASRGTRFVIDLCRRQGKPVRVIPTPLHSSADCAIL